MQFSDAAFWWGPWITQKGNICGPGADVDKHHELIVKTSVLFAKKCLDVETSNETSSAKAFRIHEQRNIRDLRVFSMM